MKTGCLSALEYLFYTRRVYSVKANATLSHVVGYFSPPGVPFLQVTRGM